MACVWALGLAGVQAPGLVFQVAFGVYRGACDVSRLGCLGVTGYFVWRRIKGFSFFGLGLKDAS